MKHNKHKKNKFVRAIFAALFTLALSAAAAVGVFAVKGFAMHKEAMERLSVEAMAEKIGSSGGFVEYSALPEFYIDAVISTEDRRFSEHCGIDPSAICRALLHDIKTLSFEQGGSTITQQLAKNLYYTQEKKLERKFAEVFTAFEIERKLNKSEIFELYVNSIYFGSGYYGIGSAAKGYFGKAPAELTEYECAMLAGLPNAPSAYSPDKNPKLARERLVIVLDCMTDCEKLTESHKSDILQEARD